MVRKLRAALCTTLLPLASAIGIEHAKLFRRETVTLGGKEVLSGVVLLRGDYHLAPGGSADCDFGVTVAQGDCFTAAAQIAMAAGKTIFQNTLQTGSGDGCMDGGWGQVPQGCSVRAGDWAAQFKSGPYQIKGCVHQLYQLVCTGLAADANPVITPDQVEQTPGGPLLLDSVAPFYAWIRNAESDQYLARSDIDLSLRMFGDHKLSKKERGASHWLVTRCGKYPVQFCIQPRDSAMLQKYKKTKIGDQSFKIYMRDNIAEPNIEFRNISRDHASVWYIQHKIDDVNAGENMVYVKNLGTSRFLTLDVDGTVRMTAGLTTTQNNLRKEWTFERLTFDKVWYYDGPPRNGTNGTNLTTVTNISQVNANETQYMKYYIVWKTKDIWMGPKFVNVTTTTPTPGR